MARLTQGLFQGPAGVQPSLQFLAVAGDQEKAIVGRRAEEDHDDEDLRRLEYLEIDVRPVGPHRHQGNQIQRNEVRHAD